MVGERSLERGSMTGRACGAQGSENAGVSSGMRVRIPHTDGPRFPEEGSSALGKSGPKARPRGVADGQQEENPAPAVTGEGVTEKAGMSRRPEEPVQAR